MDFLFLFFSTGITKTLSDTLGLFTEGQGIFRVVIFVGAGLVIWHFELLVM